MLWLKALATFHQSAKENSQGLLYHAEAPEYMREDSITSGYRRKLSYGACVIRYVEWITSKYISYYRVITFLITCLSVHLYFPLFFSCFLLHNETINIWSHLIGFAVFLYYLVLAIFYPPPTASSYDMAPITLQLITYQVSK